MRIRNFKVLPALLALATLVSGCGEFQATQLSSNSKNVEEEVMRTINPSLFALSEKYFPANESAPATKRIFRLTRIQLDNTAKSLLPSKVTTSVSATMPRDPLQTNYEYSEVLNFNAANFTPYTNWVESIAAAVRSQPSSLIACAAADTACLQKEARSFVVKAFRGAVPEETIANYVNFFISSVATQGLANAAGDFADVVMNSPHFVFRSEMRTNAADTLLPAEQVQNIAYSFADAPPEKVQLSSEAPEALVQTPDAVAATVSKVLSTPESRDKLMRFFAAWLEIKEPDEFTISPMLYPEFDAQTAAAVVDETKKFLNFHLTKSAPKLKDLTQSTQSFVSDSIASIYEINKGNLSGNALVDLDPTKRLGLFTQSAVIASHSGPDSTRLVKRGVFFTRKVMCLDIGGVPSGIDTTIPAVNQTERQKIEAMTNQSKCLGCHSYINPFGFVQENYDPIGRWRMTDAGFPVDPSISVNFLDEGPLVTNSPVEAMKNFTNSARFKQCFVRQLFRFYMGRQETPSDDPILRKMFFQFADGDSQDILGLLRILGSSNRFSQRVEK